MGYEALFAETVLMRGPQGDQIDAYLARPLGTGPYGGVVIIHHMPGWDGPTKEIARRFGHHGHVARQISTSARARPPPKKTARAFARPAACPTTGRWATCRARSTTYVRCRT